MSRQNIAKVSIECELGAQFLAIGRHAALKRASPPAQNAEAHGSQANTPTGERAVSEATPERFQCAVEPARARAFRS